jgi:hypothetical protein
VQCAVDCGPHGVCFRGSCVCAKGYAGSHCRLPSQRAGEEPASALPEAVSRAQLESDMSVFRFRERLQPQTADDASGGAASLVAAAGSSGGALRVASVDTSGSGLDAAGVLSALSADELAFSCPEGCGPNGRCLGGACYCQPGYSGSSCLTIVNPSLISASSIKSIVSGQGTGVTVAPFGTQWTIPPLLLVIGSFCVGVLVASLVKCVMRQQQQQQPVHEKAGL